MSKKFSAGRESHPHCTNAQEACVFKFLPVCCFPGHSWHTAPSPLHPHWCQPETSANGLLVEGCCFPSTQICSYRGGKLILACKQANNFFSIEDFFCFVLFFLRKLPCSVRISQYKLQLVLRPMGGSSLGRDLVPIVEEQNPERTVSRRTCSRKAVCRGFQKLLPEDAAAACRCL